MMTLMISILVALFHPSAPVAAELVEPPTEDRAGSWTVERGDHLWSIASRTLGAVRDETATGGDIAEYWRLVIAGNPQLGDANLILPGDMVRLPPLEARPVTVEVFYLRGEQLESVEETVTAPAVGGGALRALLRGPQQDDLTSEVPEGTELLGLTVADGIATVDLSSQFESGGGTLSARARVAQVVFTLTQFDTVDAVVFHIDGERVTTITSEGLLVEEPIDRSRFSDLGS